jgi:protein-L-isoaspartate(D-aspartate) O-methyltransferase
MVPNMPYIIQSPLIDIKRLNVADQAMNRLVWRLAGGFIAMGIAIPLVRPACERYPPLGAGLVIVFAAYVSVCAVHGTRSVRAAGWTVMQIRDALVYRPALWASIVVMILLAVAIGKLRGITPDQAAVAAVADQEGARFMQQREAMVRIQIEGRGVKDRRVLDAMLKVPRHLFVPEPVRQMAYVDCPLSIGEGQTISQPYIVAYMTEALRLKTDERVLEIGTGSGYQAAILAEMVREVYSIEIVATLAERARKALDTAGYANVHVRAGDGYKGWPEQAPFDAVIVTCAPESIPVPLVEQLREGGRIIIPVGPENSIQRLVRGVKQAGRIETESVLDVRFVPMVKEQRGFNP